MLMYFMNYVDRNAIAQARLNNLEDDLGMTGVQFNTTVSMSVTRSNMYLRSTTNYDAVCSLAMSVSAVELFLLVSMF